MNSTGPQGACGEGWAGRLFIPQETTAQICYIYYIYIIYIYIYIIYIYIYIYVIDIIIILYMLHGIQDKISTNGPVLK